MENKKKSNLKYYIYAIVPIVSFIAVAVMTSYSFYLATVVGNEDYGEESLRSANVTAIFDANQSLNADSVLPGYTGNVEFSIYNNSRQEDAYGQYTLMWDIEKNEVDSDDFVYTLEGTSTATSNSDKDQVVNVSTPTRIPTVSTNIGSGMINTNVTHNYVLKVIFKETGETQNNLQGKIFKAKITARELNEEKVGNYEE